MILSLYPHILVPILAEWVRDRDVCVFDTAVCIKGTRDHFLSTTLSKCIISNGTQDLSRDYLQWVLMRGIKLMKYKLSNKYCSALKSELKALLKHCKIVSCLEVGAADFACYYANLGIKVNSLKLTSYDNVDSLNFILTDLGGVISLDLSVLPSMSVSACYIIASSCPHLKNLAVSRYSDVSPILELCYLDAIKYCTCQDVFPGPVLAKSFSCELVKCQEENQSTVSVYGKHYNIKGLLIHRDMSEEEVKFLNDSLAQLESLDVMQGYNQVPLLALVATKCQKITSLSFQSVCFDDLDFASLLVQSPLIREISMRKCQIRANACLEAIADRCPKLESLFFIRDSLERTFCETGMLRVFKCCSMLKTVTLGVNMDESIWCNAIQDIDVLEISYSHGFSLRYDTVLGLKRAVFSCTKLPKVKHLSILFGNNPKLQKLKVMMEHNFDVQMMFSLVNLCPLLEEFVVNASCQTMTFLVPIGRFSNLISLCITNLGTVYEDVMQRVLKRLPNLKKIALLRCGGKVGDVLRFLPQHCPKMEYVDVSYCSGVHDDDVIHLLNNGIHLHHLNLKGCQSVTESVLPHLVLSRMRKVNVMGTRVSEKRVEAFTAETGSRCICFE